MSDICTDNRFELIEKYKKELIESTNIETSQDEMMVLDNLLFRFWQMGWLDSIDRMLLVKESAKTLMHSVGNSVSAKAFRNAGRFIQNAIDGEAPEFEKIPSAESEIIRCKDCKYFEYDHLYIVRGIPVIGHLVCNKWGDGCRTDENGFCFMAERRIDE